ncbi:MAG: glycerol-3-phosphate dehydrogenase [Rhodospirillaceae bacterium]|nr:glycerol-3-phosphate dehydrogenase [Rhodospirillaceae bacterium]
MREGSLEPPKRVPIDWQSPEFYDEAALEKEMRRVFDICHGCRLCFNLCDSFPRLFDLVDAAGDKELEGVATADFKQVVDACTLCDICFMTKCPYVPPHAFNLDFPHLMLRYRAVQHKKGEIPTFWEKQLTATDRNGRLCSHMPGIANWASDLKNGMTRGMMEKVAGVDRKAALPKYHGKTLEKRAKAERPAVNKDAPAYGRKAALFATCFSNYNNPAIGEAMQRILAHNGVEAEVVYPGCCGMPKLEHGDIAAVAESAKTVSAALKPYIDKGYDIVALVPSCALMLKFEWPMILPGHPEVEALSKATRDAAQYVVEIAKKGLAPGLKPLDGGVTLHISCHSRAQNMGQKASEMLRLIPGIDLKVIERCSGHGGSWGVMKGNFDTALKVGKPVARQAVQAKKNFVASECPLAGMHVLQGMERIEEEGKIVPDHAPHPIELFARAYGLG